MRRETTTTLITISDHEIEVEWSDKESGVRLSVFEKDEDGSRIGTGVLLPTTWDVEDLIRTLQKYITTKNAK